MSCSVFVSIVSCNALSPVNSLALRQNGRFIAYDIFKCIFINENFLISTKKSLRVVPKGPIDSMSALVQIMAWHRTGDKPLSEAMMAQFGDTYMRLPAPMS